MRPADDQKNSGLRLRPRAKIDVPATPVDRQTRGLLFITVPSAVMAIRLRSTALAVSRVLQCVAPTGSCDDRCSTSSSTMVRGAPGRGPSPRPSRRRRTTGPRNLPHGGRCHVEVSRDYLAVGAFRTHQNDARAPLVSVSRVTALISQAPQWRQDTPRVGQWRRVTGAMAGSLCAGS